ncbi:hypothetical protein ACOMHN_014555 [Nucella lapillus]
MNTLRSVKVFLVTLMFYASGTGGQGPCSQCKEGHCYPVRICRDSSGRDCITRNQCVKSNLIIGQTNACSERGVPVLRRIMVMYAALPCSPEVGDCQGQNLYCQNRVCCSVDPQDNINVDIPTVTPGIVLPYTQLPAHCQPACRIHCDFGLQQDARGCPICVCQPHPCFDMKCGPGEKCTVSHYACGNRTCFAPNCIRELEPGRCRPVTCGLLCAHGWATDPRSGCPICQCRSRPGDNTDLCQQLPGFRCPSDRHCEMRELPCLAPPCDRAPVCVRGRSIGQPCSPNHCRMFCPYGFVRDADNCEMCSCRRAPDCSQMKCGPGQECRIRNNEAVCVDVPRIPCARVECRMFCTHGFARDANNCEICTCNAPPDCSQMTCDEGKECRVISNKPVCVDLIPRTPCSRVQCRMLCTHGFARDANNCEICTCNMPPDCSQMDCGTGKVCQIVNEEPVCVAKPDFPCARVECRMFCTHGLARDANNCEICSCRATPPDCSQMVCGAGQQCQIINGEASCTDSLNLIPKTPCSRVQCRMFCTHGFARDANNCEMCSCNAPPDCSQMNCGMGKVCQIRNGGAVCVDALPDIPCARTPCRMLCPYGFERDANNCETCTCKAAPDCSQMNCGAGKECQIINNEATCVDSRSGAIDISGRTNTTPAVSPQQRQHQRVQCFILRLLNAAGRTSNVRLQDICPP